MNYKTKIKVLERENAEALESAVNEFLDALEFDPVKITYGNSFSWEFDDGLVLYTPTYTAVIEYLAAPGNIKAVKDYDDTWE